MAASFLSFTRDKEREKKETGNRIVQIHVDDIVPNPHQPRTDFDYAEINSLADSICQNGILQPLSVRKIDGGYELIAGERRLRAAKMNQMKFVPCIIFDITERTSAVLALVENIQRRDLSFFDEAMAIEKLITYYGMTQEDAAIKLGKAQSTIANKLRILKLSDEEKEIITKFNLTERHARALIRLSGKEDRMKIIDKIVKYNYNVDKTEKAIDEYIGKEKEKESFKKRKIVFKNVRLFVNTINRAVETMKAAGIEADSKKIQSEHYIEYRVKIPITKCDDVPRGTSE
ncbi:MAG: ParB/RepB/Spo0J family partition protein [Porcipelethomonas sp.]